MEYQCEERLKKNPNLYIRYSDSVVSGYILAESGATIISESDLHTLSFGV